MTAAEAARIVGCSDNLIHRLIEDEVITVDPRPGKRKHHHITMSKQDLRKAVAENVPRYGYKKNMSKSTIKTVKLNGHQKMDDGLKQIIALASIDKEKRALLLRIAQRFSVDELSIILEL